MSAHDLRSRQDLKMSEDLLQMRPVQRVNEMIERQEAEGPMGTRRQLLATSVRMTRSMAPALHKTADACIEALAVDIPVEHYVFASSQFNAMCVKPEDGRLFILFSSSLLEGFDETEFKFVMGHELGHYLYGHHDIPIGYLMRGQSRPDPKLALHLTAWSRHAEISADRAGAHCAHDLTGVSRALFKLASGLTGSLVDFDLNAFMAQVDDMQHEDAEPGAGAPTGDWFMTHPFSPLRVRALKLFHESELVVPGGKSLDELDAGVQALMGLMEPSYLEGRTTGDESMRRLLFAGALAVARADGQISPDEIAVFEQFLGSDSYSDSLNLHRLEAEIPGRVRDVCEAVGIGRRLQVLRDLATVACSDGEASQPEREVLRGLARDLGVGASLVDQFLCGVPELD